MIRLIVTDVDGTIVGKDEVLCEEMVEFVEDLRRQGIDYTLATGRVEELVRPYVERLGICLPYAACNGGTIACRGKILERKTIPLRPLRRLIETADEMDMSVLYSVDGREMALRETDYVREQQIRYGRYLEPVPIQGEQWESLRVEKVIVMAKVRDGSIGAIETLCRQLAPAIGYKRYADKAIDILSPEALKENGVRNLARRLGLGMDQVLFVGDDLNDVASLREAGIGVAVANAQECAKEAADYVAAGCCYKGVIEAVEKFVLRREQ